MLQTCYTVFINYVGALPESSIYRKHIVEHGRTPFPFAHCVGWSMLRRIIDRQGQSVVVGQGLNLVAEGLREDARLLA